MIKKRINNELKKVKNDLLEHVKLQNGVPIVGVKKTAELVGTGVHYFIDLEHKFTQDFFFGWLPAKIKKYIKLIIPFLLMLVILYLPLSVDPAIKKSLALFVCIGALWALEPVNIVVTSLMIPVLAVLLGLVGNDNPFESFSNPIIYLLLSGLILAQAFRKHELDKRLAYGILALSKGDVRKLLFATMLSTALLGMFMSNTATIALVIPVLLSLSNQVNKKLNKNYTAMFLLAGGFASSIGGIATILGSSSNAIAAAFLENYTKISFLDWVVIGLPISIILFLVAYFIFVKIFSLENGKISLEDFLITNSKFSYEQKKLLLIFSGTLFLWLFGSHFLPPAVDRVEIIGVTSAIMLFAFRVLDWNDVRRVPWEIFLLVGGGLTLGQLLIKSGAAELLATKIFVLKEIFPNFPSSLIILFLIAVTIVLTNFLNNSSATVILVPVILNLSTDLGLNVVLLAIAAAMATAIAPITPIANPAFSLIYGTGQVSRKDMVRTGVSISLICGTILAGMIYVFNLL